MYLTKPEDMAVEIGQRCRRVRMAKGISQQALADLAETTAQNISKLEKNGISDIFWIKKLSDILETNLQNDETDEEGVIGEVGKEILYTLVCNEGHLESNKLLSTEMYGYANDRVSHEIFKLMKIGMVVREEYNGWDGKKRDITFITAKGLITFKNMQLNERMSEDVYEMLEMSDMKTYEQIIGKYKNYQDLIDSREAERLIRNIHYPDLKDYLANDDLKDDIISSDYRINYVYYLKQNFEIGYESDIINTPFDEKEKRFLTGENVFYDVLFRMALGIKKLNVFDDMLEVFKWMIDSKDVEIEDDFADEFENSNVKKLLERFGFEGEEKTEQELPRVIGGEGITEEEINVFVSILKSINRVPTDELMDKIGFDPECQNRVKKLNDWYFIMSRDIKEIYAKNASLHQETSPAKWFSKEEIEEYINTYMGPARTEEERLLDETIARINQLCPETLEYYKFPNTWEENGLADLIRRNYNIPKGVLSEDKRAE